MEMNWKEIGYQIAMGILPESLRLHDFKVVYSTKGVHFKISLDNIQSPLGSPTLTECASYSRVYDSHLEEFLMQEGNYSDSLSKSYTIEISSPGVSREVKFPEELARFNTQPMKVKYYKGNNDTLCSEVLLFHGSRGDAQLLWQIADTNFNRKQGVMNKNKKTSVFEIPTERIRQVNLYIDI